MDDEQLTPRQQRVESLKLTYAEHSRIQAARRMLQSIDDILPEGTNVREQFEVLVDDLLRMERYGYRDAVPRKQTAESRAISAILEQEVTQDTEQLQSGKTRLKELN